MEIVKEESVAFARVSSREQEETGYSLPEQERSLKEYCEKNDYQISEIFSISESASGRTQRRVFNKMMEYLVAKGINVVVVETTDRLTRNFKDVPVIDKWVQGDEGRQIHLVKEGCVLQSNSKSHEWFMWRVKVATAEYYIRLLSENVKKGQKGKIAEGWLPTKPPLGYKTVGKKGRKIHVVDEETAPYIRKIFQLYATGNYSVKSLCEKMYQMGLRNRRGNKLGKTRMHKLLINPFYYGKFVWNGKKYDGKHKALIGKRLFDTVQEKLSESSTSPYYNKYLRVLQGKVMCGDCERTVSWEKQKGKLYGGCKQCKAQLDVEKKYIRQDKLESLLVSKIVSVAPKNQRVLQVLKKALKESHSEELGLYEAQKESMNNQISRIKQRMSEMYDDKLDGRISAEMYDEKFSTFKGQVEDLQQTLKELESNSFAYYESGIAIHELATNAEKIYFSKKATVEQKRLFLSYALSEIKVYKGKVEVKYTQPFQFLAKWMPKVNKSFELSEDTENNSKIKGEVHKFINNDTKDESSEKSGFRTSKNGSIETQKGTSVAPHPELLRLYDEIRTYFEQSER